MIIDSIKYALSRWRLLLTVMIVQLGLSMLIGLQVYEVFQSSIGTSLSLEGLKLNNAHMVINDLLNVHGASLSPLLGMLRWLVLLYLVASAFMHSGIWNAIIHPEQENGFWNGGAKYFTSCLLIGVISMFFLAVWTGLLWVPYVSNMRTMMESWQNESIMFYLGVGIAIVWALGCSFLFLFASRSRIVLIKEKQSVGRSMRVGFIQAIKNWQGLILPFLTLAVILVFLYWIPSMLDDMHIATTTFGIILLFLIHQIAVFFRLGIRLSSYKLILDHPER